MYSLNTYKNIVDTAQTLVGAYIELPMSFSQDYMIHPVGVEQHAQVMLETIANLFRLSGEELDFNRLPGVVQWLSQHAAVQFSKQLLASWVPAWQGEVGMYFLEPNIARYARKYHLNDYYTRLTVALHETTHLYESLGTPWHDAYLTGLIQATLTQFLIRCDSLDELSRPEVIKVLRSGALLDHDLTEKIRIAMMVSEGLANHVMFAAARPIMAAEDARTIRKAFSATRPVYNPVALWWRWLLRAKDAQYITGQLFVDSIVAYRGVAAIRTLLSGPESLPTRAELNKPSLWLERN